MEFDGDVWFLSKADTRKVREIEARDDVHLTSADNQEFVFLAMSGRAQIVRDAEKKRALWLPGLARWFTDAPESDAIVLIKVSPRAVALWNGEEGGEITPD